MRHFPWGHWLRSGAFIGLCLSILSGFAVFAYNGDLIRWNLPKGQSIPWILNPKGCKGCDFSEAQIRSIFTASYEKWNNVEGSYFEFSDLSLTHPELFTADPTLANKEPKYDDGYNVLGFSDTVPSGFAGYARFKTDESGHITEADIFLAPDLKYTEEELESVVTHELGHTFGLGHDHTDTESVMSYGRDRTRQRLGVDDIIGITTLYPHSGNEPQVDLGCATLGQGTPPPFFDGALLSFLGWLMLAAGCLAALKRASHWKSKLLWKPFWQGVWLGGGLVTWIVACAPEVQEPLPSSRASSVGSLTDLKTQTTYHFWGTEQPPSHATKELTTPLMVMTRDSLKQAKTYPLGPQIDGNLSLKSGLPLVDGEKVTFFCPRGR